MRSEVSGRWAAVFIPYREIHDANHYVSVIKDLTFPEVAAMPYAKTAAGHQDLFLSFRMRDRSMYCARPREITEEIGLVFVIWDTTARDTFSSAIVNATFNCEIEISGGCVPHIIFGPKHRVAFLPEKFKLRSITSGDEVRVHEENTVRLETYSDDDII